MEPKSVKSVGVLVKCHHWLFNSDSMSLYFWMNSRAKKELYVFKVMFKLFVIAGQGYVVGGYLDFSNFCGL